VALPQQNKFEYKKYTLQGLGGYIMGILEIMALLVPSREKCHLS